MAHPEEDRTALGARLATVRKDVGFSLDGAASELTRRGYTIGKAAIGAWETGRNVPDALWLVRLAKLYGTTLDGLIRSDSSTWPFTDELLATVDSLNTDGLVKLEGVMRAHLGMAPLSATQSHALATQPVTDPTVGRTTVPPAPKSRPNLERAFLGDRSASGAVGKVQKQGTGRGAKGTPRRG